MKTTYATDSGDLVIEFDYQPAESSTQWEPGCPESADVYSVMAGNFEIIDMVSDDYMAFFEEKAIESVHFEREQAAYDRADRAYQSRKDDALSMPSLGSSLLTGGYFK
jgi:hypothetical protein